MGAIELIKSDLFRYAGTTSSKEFIKTYVKEAVFRFSVAFRLVSAGGALKLLGAILWKLRNHQQIQILRKTKIGYGLYTGHGGPVVIRQHRTIAEASAVESPIRQETIGFPAHFFARAHNFKPPGRACQPEADSPMRT